MKNRITVLLIGATLAVLSGGAAAHDSVSFGISIGVPGPAYVAPPVVYYPAPPAYYAPPVYYYGPPVYYAPAPWVFIGRGRGGHYRGRHWRHRGEAGDD